MTAVELKPCPFCGATPILKRHPEIVGIVCGSGSQCDNSGLCIAFSPAKEAQAIAAWNHRAAPQSAVPPIKGAWVDGGYVIVVPAGVGREKASALRDAILAAAPSPDKEG